MRILLKWEGLLAVKKPIQTRVRGPRRKTIALLLTLELMVKVAGVHFLKPLAFLDVARVADFAGSTT